MKNNLIFNNIDDRHLKELGQKKFKKKIIKCEICSSKKFITLQNIGRVGVPGVYGFYNIMICKQCSFKFANPRYVDDFYLKYYKKNYRKIAFGSFKPSRYYVKNQIFRGKNILKFFDRKIKIGNMLDHGCASGATMLAWKKAGWNTYGIDPHVPSVNYGIKKYKLNIKPNFGENLEFKDDFFDLILSLGSLEHSYDIDKTLKEIRRVLKINGKIIIRWRSDKLIGSPLEYYNHNHYRFFTKKTLRNILAKYGFKVISNYTTPLEGYSSFRYVLAKKVISKKIKLEKYENDYKNEIKKHQKYILKYHKICLKVQNLKKKKVNFNQENFIKKFNIKLLAIQRKKALKRFFFESSKYLETIKLYD